MKNVLIIATVFNTLLLMGAISILGYKYGQAKGELKKMEEFRELYVPNPSNVFPDASETINEIVK